MAGTEANETDMQSVLLDNDERRIINAYREIRRNEFGEIIAKVHRRELVTLRVTNAWHADGKNGKLREEGK